MNKKVIIMIGVLLFLLCCCSLVSGTLALNYKYQQDRINSITDYNSCIHAGFPIMDSYPEQCSAYGKTYTNIPENAVLPIPHEYYGSSTNGKCTSNSDCIEMGCNSEICGSKNEASDKGVSTCVFPDQPLPRDLGYSCGCVNNMCQWGK
jgi:eight-cysteine-cluster-containing protein